MLGIVLQKVTVNFICSFSVFFLKANFLCLFCFVLFLFFFFFFTSESVYCIRPFG